MIAVATLASGAALLLVQPAGAAPVGPVNPLAAALGFGVMTEGDATVVTSENEGTMAVGGTVTFSQYQLAANSAGTFVVPGDSNPTALVVGGRVNLAGSSGRLQILQNGYAKIGDLTGTVVRNTDNNGASVNTRILPTNNYDAAPRIELVTRQPVASVGPASPIDFAAAFGTFRSTSTSLATCTNTVLLGTPNGDVLPRPIPPGSNAVVTLTPGMTNVLNLSATDLDDIAILTFTNPPTADTPLLVNVDTSVVGDIFSWAAPNFAGISGQQAPYLLFNFPTATSIHLIQGGATLEGAIYAPNADLVDDDPTNTEGSIISRTYVHNGGEVHYFPFNTTLACQNASPTGTPTSGQPTVTPTGTPTPTVRPTLTPTPTWSPTATPSRSTPAPPYPSWSWDPGHHAHPWLPVTGPRVGPMIGLGGGMVALGSALLLLLALISMRQRRQPGTGDHRSGDSPS